ncbi:MAG: M20/M25/M40 family metallo-hydrolase [Bacteroidales bacterium]|nr:M20/M25/M40 family metallo-hydrolase [Bacteroidales bacterium]
MKKFWIISLLATVSFFGFSQNKATHHVINVQVNPSTSHITVTDSIFTSGKSELVMSLNASFKVTSFSKNAKAEKISGTINAKDVGMDRDENSGEVKLNKWKIKLKKSADFFVVKYEGDIVSGFSTSEEDYARGFSETAGIISDSGVYLAGSSHWIPVFDEEPLSFSLTSSLPEGWKTVSQGKRTSEFVSGGKHFDTWICDTPQEEAFLIAARFTEYSFKMNSGIDAMAFLRTPDEGLANKYLEVTEQYMDMYQKMIGPYPYTKFALVENFWETGYGMPSFTLLGEKIIRFPFILHSSYPHELLHNWWGNSVYVDFDKGNWCEGITAYEADHLISEQRGQGEEYRRSTLQKFTDVVTEANDFPLSSFISRTNAESEAIGYGKSMMMWHMLRRKLGDENFKKGFSLFYENFKFKKASFDDIRSSMEKASGTDLQTFFNQWVMRTGAPEIEIKDVKTEKTQEGYKLLLTLAQIQSSDAFDVDIPLVVSSVKGLRNFVVNMNEKTQEFSLILSDEPLKLEVDPQYDVFRKLDPMEVPPGWTKILASEENLVILPSKSDQATKELYTEFFEQWRAVDKDHFDIVFDNEVSRIPADKIVWIIGFENKFVPQLNESLKNYQSSISKDSVIFQNNATAKENHSFVFTLFNPGNSNYSMAFIAFDNKNAIDGLIRKLPHYGKYSYLGFEGDEPVNVDKGQWPVFNSPLVKVLSDKKIIDASPEKREALAMLAPVFSEQRMMAHITYLASDELKGRGLGTPELDSAADYIAGKFKEYGLETMGDSYFQSFTHTFPDKGEMQLKNVVAIIPGSDSNLKDSPVVISAHYDHLGLGWPDVHKGEEGKIHHGADDNASGVAVMLEVAKSMASTVKPKRTIIFVAFTGEEAGLIGSRYFISQIKKYYSGEILADVNLDTDGSLFDKKLLVLNGNSAKEWKFVFMGTDYTTGVKSEVVQQELDASDQVAFIEKGIPAVQLFTGATENYHRPSDSFDKIDGKGLVKVATVAKEVMVYLGDRDTPFEFTGSTTKTSPEDPNKPKASRKASTGSVPDFAYTGTGVRIASVVAGSVGEKAGLLENDIITEVNGKEVPTLMDYSNELKTFQPGDVVKLKILRDGKEKIISITLGER